MYSRTQNDNGTYNTRCLDCFMTIASCVETAQELDILEARHICPEKALAYLLAQQRSIVARSQRNQEPQPN
jgi:hypothetical protein